MKDVSIAIFRFLLPESAFLCKKVQFYKNIACDIILFHYLCVVNDMIPERNASSLQENNNNKKYNYMDKNISIATLQAFATGLSAQSYAHKVQGLLFASQGFGKLGEKYASHATEEMGYVEKFIDRILDLGGEAKVEATPSQKIYTNAEDFLKADLKVSVDNIPVLRQAMAAVAEDYVTFDILKDYLKDEEEDMFWSEEQLGLISLIGYQIWLIKQM